MPERWVTISATASAIALALSLACLILTIVVTIRPVTPTSRVVDGDTYITTHRDRSIIFAQLPTVTEEREEEEEESEEKIHEEEAESVAVRAQVKEEPEELGRFSARRRFGINTSAPQAWIHIQGNTDEPQMRLGYDTHNSTDLRTDASGALHVNTVAQTLYMEDVEVPGTVWPHVATLNQSLTTTSDVKLQSLTLQGGPGTLKLDVDDTGYARITSSQGRILLEGTSISQATWPYVQSLNQMLSTSSLPTFREMHLDNGEDHVRMHIADHALDVISTAGITVNGSPILTGPVLSLQGLTVSGNTNSGNVLSTGEISGATLAGSLTTAAQPNVTSLGTLSSLAVTGNIAAGNVLSTGEISGAILSGSLTTASQPNVTSVGTLSSLAVTANIAAGNILSTGEISGATLSGSLTTAAQPNVTSLGTLTSLTVTGNVTGGNLITSGLVSGGTLTGFLTTASQPNITSVGTLSSLTVTGNVTGGNLITSGLVSGATVAGTLTTASQPNITSVGPLSSLTVTGNVTGGNLITSGLVSGATVAGTLTTASQPNVTSLGTLSSLDVTANVSSGNVIATSLVQGATLAGSLTTASQPNITSVGTLGSLDVTANVSAGNVIATSLVQGATLAGSLTTAAQPNITSVGTLASLTVTGNVTGGNLITSGLISGATLTGTLTTAVQPNVTSVGTLSSLTVTGNVTGGNLITSGLVSGVTLAGTLTTAAQPNITQVGSLDSAFSILSSDILSTSNVAQVQHRFVATGTSSGSAGSFLGVYVDDGAAMGAGHRLGGLLMGAASDASGTLRNALAITGVASQSWSNSVYGTNMLFETTASGSSSRVERMRIGHDGNVGIATSAPTAKLHVVGNILATTEISGATLTGSLTTAAQPNVTSVGTLAQLTVTGNVFTTGNASFGTLTPNIVASGVDRVLQVTSATTGNASVIQATNSSQSSFLTCYSGCVGNIDPFVAYANTGNLRLGTWSNLVNPVWSEKIRVDAAGNVGIGTTAPTTLLHVANGDITIRGASGYPSLYVGTATSNHVGLTWDVTNDCAAVATSSNGKDIRIGANYLCVKGVTGNVGLGTTNPVDRLTVDSVGTNDRGITLLGASSSSGQLRYSTGGGTFLDLLNDAGTSIVKLRSYGASYINGGNVGIGTATPGTKLQVYTGSTRGFTQTDGTITVGSFIGGSTSAGWYGTFTNHPLCFFTNDSTAQVTLLTSGNVGIGNTNPSSTLHVVGRIQIDNGANDPSNYGQALQITNLSGRSQQIAFIRNGNNVISCGYMGASNIWGFGGGTATDASFSPSILCANLATSMVAIGTTNPVYQFELSSNSAAKPTGGQWTAPSDVRLKTNIVDANLQECLDTICALRVREFDYHPQYAARHCLPSQYPYWGVIAQELEPVAPFCVGQISGTRSWCGCVHETHSEAQHCDQCEPLVVENMKDVNLSELEIASFGAIQQLKIRCDELEQLVTTQNTTIQTLEQTLSAMNQRLVALETS